MLLVFGLAAMEKALGLMLLVYLGGTFAVGVYEAWTHKRSALGWIVSIVCSVIGGTFGGLALGIGAMAAVDAMGLSAKWAELDALVGLFATIIGMLLGSWLVLRTVNRFR